MGLRGRETPQARGDYYGAGFAEGRRTGYLEGHRAGFFEGHRAGWDQAMAARAHGAAREPVPAAPAPLATLPPGAVPQAPPQPLAPRPAAARPEPAATPAPAPPSPPSSAPTWLGAAWPEPAVSAAQATSAPEAPAETPVQRRERRGIQSVNIALYTASLLIVAAGALFLTNSSVRDGVRLAGLASITGLFYAAGLIVHTRFPRLRPAAVAFTGTGLALLPVTGLALDVVVLHRAELSWLVTSAVGLVAFGFAAIRLESRVLVFLSLPFAFSAAWSGSEVLGGALAMDFAFIIGLSAVLGAVTVARPRWIPPLILRPVAVLDPYVVPAVFVAATLSAGELERGQYPALVAAMSAFFAVSALVKGPPRARRLSWWAARTTAAIAAGIGAAQAVDARGTGASWLDVTPFEALAVAASAAICLGAALLVAFEGRLARVLSLDRTARLAEQCVGVGVQFALLLAVLGSGTLRWPVGASQAAVLVAFILFAVTAQLVAWWFGGSAEVLALLALAALALVRPAVDPWPFAGLVLWALAYWVARAVRPVPWGPGVTGAVRAWQRAHFVAMARIVSLPAAAVVVDAWLPEGTARPMRVAAVAFAVAVAAAAQLAATATLGLRQRPEYRRGEMATVLAVVAEAALLVVGGAEPEAASILFVPTASAVCAGAVALSAGLYLARPRGKGHPDAGELVPPLLLTAVALSAFSFDRWSVGNAVLTLLVLLLAAAAWRAHAALRRWTYIWLGRAAATFLAVMLFHAGDLEGWHPEAFGQRIDRFHVLAAAALVQIVVPLAVGLMKRKPPAGLRWAVHDAAAVLAVGALSLALLVPRGAYPSAGTGDGPGPLTATLIVAAAVGAALAGAVLRHRPAALTLAPTAYVLSWPLSGGDLRILEIITGVYAVFAALMVYLAVERAAKGAHFVAARALPIVLAALIARDASASVTWVSVVVALGLAAQHVVPLVLRRTTAALPFREPVYWSALGAQLALPIAYAAVAGDEAEGGRWVLLFEAALVVASVIGTMRGRVPAGYVGLVAAALGLIWCGPTLSLQAGQFLAEPILRDEALPLVAAGLSTVHLVGMSLWDGPRMDAERRASAWPWTAGAALFAAVGLVTAVPERPWVWGLAVAASAAALVAASYVWGYLRWTVAATFPLGMVLTLAAGESVAQSAFDPFPGPWRTALVVLVGTLVPAAAAVALRWAGRWAGTTGARIERRTRLAADPVRRWSVAGMAALALAASAWRSWEPPAHGIVPLLAAALAAVIVPELPALWRRLGAEIGVVVVAIGAQRAVFAQADSVQLFWIVQWHVVLAAVLALARYYADERTAGRSWLGASAALLSFTGLYTVFQGGTPEQVWLLVAFAVLVVVGLVVGERGFVVWGVVGVVACVLWAVRAYAYALLGVLGAALIAAAIWWLLRAKGARSS